MYKSTKPLITVKEARKALGSAGAKLSDNEIRQLNIDSEFVVRTILKEYLVRNSSVVK